MGNTNPWAAANMPAATFTPYQFYHQRNLPAAKPQATSLKRQASSAKLLKVQAASFKRRAASIKLQAASGKLKDLVSFIKI
jgi:hypothetical protein